jgi:hypothetical protein
LGDDLEFPNKDLSSNWPDDSKMENSASPLKGMNDEEQARFDSTPSPSPQKAALRNMNKRVSFAVRDSIISAYKSS